jgi:hypothetical protein
VEKGILFHEQINHRTKAMKPQAVDVADAVDFRSAFLCYLSTLEARKFLLFFRRQTSLLSYCLLNAKSLA